MKKKSLLQQYRDIIQEDCCYNCKHVRAKEEVSFFNRGAKRLILRCVKKHCLVDYYGFRVYCDYFVWFDREELEPGRVKGI